MFRHFAIIFTIIIAFFVLSPAAFAAAYIKFDGIDGESAKTSDGHKDWIVIESFSHGIGQSRQSTTGAARRRGTVSPYDVTVIKPVDAASPKILEAATKGKVFPKVTIKYEHNARTYTSTLFNVQISSVEQKGSGEPWPKEHVSFTYQKISWEYKGGNDRTEARWDVKGGR